MPSSVPHVSIYIAVPVGCHVVRRWLLESPSCTSPTSPSISPNLRAREADDDSEAIVRRRESPTAVYHPLHPYPSARGFLGATEGVCCHSRDQRWVSYVKILLAQIIHSNCMNSIIYFTHLHTHRNYIKPILKQYHQYCLKFNWIAYCLGELFEGVGEYCKLV